MKYIFLLTLTSITMLARGQSKMNQEEVYDRIVELGMVHPVIVLKQAIHESANFKSKGARNKNNILGIMNPSGRALRYFESVTACLTFYKEHVQSRYEGGDYYDFLRKKKYAADPHYERKVDNVELDFQIE